VPPALSSDRTVARRWRDDGRDGVARDTIARDTGRRYFPSPAAAPDRGTVARGPIQGSGWRGRMPRDEVAEEATVVVRRMDAGEDDLVDAGAVRIAGGSAEDLDAPRPASAGAERKFKLATQMTFDDGSAGAWPADAATFGGGRAAWDEGTGDDAASLAARRVLGWPGGSRAATGQRKGHVVCGPHSGTDRALGGAAQRHLTGTAGATDRPSAGPQGGRQLEGAGKVTREGDGRRRAQVDRTPGGYGRAPPD
jgi:hypothetical protein